MTSLEFFKDIMAIQTIGPSAKVKYAPRPRALRMRLKRREVIIASEPYSRAWLGLWKKRNTETKGQKGTPFPCPF